MTVVSTDSRKSYAGNGVTTSFDTNPVIFFDSSELTVYVVTTATGVVVATLVEDTTYTVTGGDGTTGTINTAAGSAPYGAPAAGTTLLIVRELPLTQESDFVNNDPSDAEVAEDALDRLTMMAQQLDTRLDRSFSLADTDISGASTVIATPAATSLIGWDSAGTTLQNYTTSDLSTALTTAFTLTLLDDSTSNIFLTTLTATRSETGAAAVPVLTKLREVMSPVDFGATGDAVADDTTPVQKVFTALFGALTKTTGYLVSALTAAANTYVRGLGRSSPIKLSGSGGLKLYGSYVNLDSIRIDGQATTQALYADTGASNVSLRNLDITTANAASGQHGIQNAATGTDAWSIAASKIRSNGYAYLLNDGTAGISGLIVNGNYLDSRTADALAINTPTTKFQDAAIVGNVLKSQNVGADVNSGFAFSLAQADGVAYVGNVIQESRQEAIHIEDGSENVVVVGNISKVCRESGMRVILGGTGSHQALAKPVTIIGNQFEASSAVAGEAGIYIVEDGNGVLQSCPVIGNVVRGFETGLYLGGDGQHFADGNTIQSCTYAMRVDTGGGTRTVVEGTNFVKSCTNLLFASGATSHMVSVGKFVCEDKPTNILSRTSVTRPGCDFKGFSWPQNQLLTAGVNTYAILFPAAATCRFDGKITLRARNIAAAADNTWYSANVSWDGATLTITAPILEYNGALAMVAAPALRVNAGNLEAGYFDAAAITIRVDMNFDGIYMV